MSPKWCRAQRHQGEIKTFVMAHGKLVTAHGKLVTPSPSQACNYFSCLQHSQTIFAPNIKLKLTKDPIC